MPWLLASPGHQPPWYWLCRMSRSLSYLKKDFNYLRHVNVEEWQNVKYFFVPLEQFIMSRVKVTKSELNNNQYDAKVNGFPISPPDGLFWWFWSNQVFLFDFSFTFWEFAEIIDDFEAIKYLTLYLISHSPSESLLTLWTTASGMPISWMPTSDGWIRISGMANRSLFKRIVWNTQHNINSWKYRCHTSESQLYMKKNYVTLFKSCLIILFYHDMQISWPESGSPPIRLSDS